MSFFKIFLPPVVIIIFFISCSNGSKDKIIGKWKVIETGYKGLEITYEFKKNKIIIESNLEKSIADSLSEISNKTFWLEYDFKSDSASFLILEVTDLAAKVNGEYRLKVEGEGMILSDFQGENIHLIKIK